MAKEPDPQEKEQALDQIRSILGVGKQPDGMATTQDVLDVAMFLIAIIANVDDQASEASRRGAGNTLSATRELIRETEKRVSAEVKRLSEFKKSLEESGMDADIEEALDLARDHAIKIKQIQRALKNIEINMPEDGAPGLAPAHEWNGTHLRFKKPDGSWGEWVNLMGPAGVGEGGGPRGVYIERITTTGSSGPATLSPGGTLNIPQYGGSGGYTLEEPSGTVDDTNVDFVFTAEPTEIVVNGSSYRKDNGWTWNAGPLTATLGFPVGTGGDIYGRMQ